VVLLSSDQITLGSSELKAFATTGCSPGFYPDMVFAPYEVSLANIYCPVALHAEIGSISPEVLYVRWSFLL